MEVPDWITREVKKVGGMRDGKPLFRIVWGAHRTRFTDDGLLYHPYQKDRWHVEKLHKGEYEHSYTLAQCPHRTDRRWCNGCFKNGGEFLPLTLAIVESVIRLNLMAERLQDAVLQKASLFEREKQKKEARDAATDGLISDLSAVHSKPKRSYAPQLKLDSSKVLGRSKFRQLKARKDGN